MHSYTHVPTFVQFLPITVNFWLAQVTLSQQNINLLPPNLNPGSFFCSPCSLSLLCPRSTCDKFSSAHVQYNGYQVNVRDIKKKVYKIDKQMKLQSSLRRELVGYLCEKWPWIVVKGVRKIQWLARALCHSCFGEDCTYPHHHKRESTELHGHKFVVCWTLSCSNLPFKHVL